MRRSRADAGNRGVDEFRPLKFGGRNPVSGVSSFDLKGGGNGRIPVVALNSGHEMPVLGLGTYALRGDACRA